MKKPRDDAGIWPGLLSRLLTWLPAGVMMVWLLGVLLGQVAHTELVPYSQFERELRDGRISEVEIGDDTMTGTLKSPRDGKTLLTTVPVEPALAEQLARQGVSYRRVHESNWFGTLLSWVAPALVFFGIWAWLQRKAPGGAGLGLAGLGGSHAKIYVQQSTGVRFADVAGVDEAKAELQELIEFLKNPKEYGYLGARIPKGVLLMGPTGTGKTLLARAVAGEADVPFFSISGSEFIEMFVGVGAARVRDLFEQARAKAPAIIFIDELDALGKARGPANLIGGHDEREQTLNQLLVELDGFDPSVGVVLLAATNRPEVLDPALLRAGRFDRQVLVNRPDRRGRRDILRVHAARVRLAAGLDLDQVAALTVGLAGADLANVVNEAALVATRRHAAAVELSDFTAAIERIVAGIEKRNGLSSEAERRLVAYHELGHALTALALPGTDRVHKVSIVPRGIGALGYTLQRPGEDRRVLRRSELRDKLVVLLGGRAAELLVFGEPSTGAADDLARASDLARDMVLRHGMDEAVGPVVYADRPPGLLFGETAPGVRQEVLSPETARRIDDGVQRALQDAARRAQALLSQNRALLDRAATQLMASEVLDESQLAALTAELRGERCAEPGVELVRQSA